MVIAHIATHCGGRLWSANADRPAARGALWPVEVESIDCKLQISTLSGDLRRGMLYGMECSTLSRVQ